MAPLPFALDQGQFQALETLWIAIHNDPKLLLWIEQIQELKESQRQIMLAQALVKLAQANPLCAEIVSKSKLLDQLKAEILVV